MGGSPSVPAPTQEEKDLQAAQTEAITTQNALLMEQLEASKQARAQLQSIVATTDAEKAQIKELQQSQISLAQESLALQRSQIERAELLEPAQFALLEQQTQIAQSQFDLLQQAIDREPTELEQKQEDIALLQAENVEKALKGELPISPQTLAAEKDEFKKLKEQLARGGIVVEGDTLQEATSGSTAGIQALQSLKQRFDAIKFAEQQGAITQGQSLLLQGAGAIANIEQRRLGTAFGNTGALLPQQQQFGLFDPTGNRLNQIGAASQLGFGTSFQGFGSLSNATSAALQPYQFQRDLQFQANKSGGGIGSLLGGIAGTALGAYTGGLGFGLGSKKGCWIARAIYGDTSTEWVLARHYIFNKWQGAIANIVRSLYSKYGERVAEIVKTNKLLKAILKPLFDRAVYNGANSILQGA